MRSRVLLDTGPLVGYLNRRDSHHAWSVEQWALIEPPLLTCESVLSEACFLLQKITGGNKAVMELLVRGVVAVPFRIEKEAEGIARLLRRYSNVPMALADACLVSMAERLEGSAILTVDSDFRIYRMRGRRVVPTIMPD